MDTKGNLPLKPLQLERQFYSAYHGAVNEPGDFQDRPLTGYRQMVNKNLKMNAGGRDYGYRMPPYMPSKRQLTGVRMEHGWMKNHY